MTHTILLVDDLASNTLLLEGMLANSDLQFLRAHSGNQALAFLREFEVSLILLDVYMPGMDGYEVARQVRADPRHACLPIIFVTAEADGESEVFDGYEAGAVDYLVKPVDARILRGKVQTLCALVEKERKIQEQFIEKERRNAQLEDLLLRHKSLEESRVESELRYHSLITLSPLPIIVQVGGVIVFSNASAMQMLGLSHERGLSGKPFQDFVHESDREVVREVLDRIARRGGRSDPVPCRLMSKGAHGSASCRVECRMHAFRFRDRGADGHPGCYRP